MTKQYQIHYPFEWTKRALQSFVVEKDHEEVLDEEDEDESKPVEVFSMKVNKIIFILFLIPGAIRMKKA